MTLLELAERCEAATGPNFQLEQDIGGTVFPERGAITHPPYTASLDAAMTLVPEDAFWRLGHDGDGADPSEFRSQVIVPKMGGADARGVALACAPALALCAASLRARAAMEPSND